MKQLNLDGKPVHIVKMQCYNVKRDRNPTIQTRLPITLKV